MNNIRNWKCKECSEKYPLTSDNIVWVEHGMYSAKLIKCHKCGHMNILKYVEGFNQNPNFEQRYYN